MAARLLELLEDFADLHIVAGAERVPASRLLLAALAPHLRPELRGPELRWPVAPQVARAAVALSCGVRLRTTREERCALQALLAPRAARPEWGRWVLVLCALGATVAAYWPIKASEDLTAK